MAEDAHKKRARSDPDTATPLVVRLYAIESCYGEEPMYVLYKSPSKSRSLRVHVAIKELVALDNEEGMPLAWGLFVALMEHKSLAERTTMDNVLSMGSLYSANDKKKAQDIVHAAYKKIDDEGAAADEFVTLSGNCSHEDEPVVSFLRFNWNA